MNATRIGELFMLSDKPIPDGVVFFEKFVSHEASLSRDSA
jgi:hypothetical protein